MILFQPLKKKLNNHTEQRTMDLIDNIIHYFKNKDSQQEVTSPEGTCAVCWGYQEYDGKILTLLEDKQIDVNNNKASYMIIQEFVKENIDGIKLKEGIVTACPDCSTASDENR